MMERKWRRQLSIPSKKGVGFGVKTTLILAQLCTVTVSELAPGFTLTAPASITVQHGLCVHVPCHFTYSNPQQGSTEELFAYWLKKKKGSKYFISSSRYVSGLLTATNDPRQRIQNRFWLTGDPEQGDSSFSIGDAQLEDSGAYYFRIERGENLRWNFVTNQDLIGASLLLLVAELTEKPTIWNSSELVFRKAVTFSCQAPGTCSGTPPQISWSIGIKDYGTSLWSVRHRNGSWTYGSTITFTPWEADQNKTLTCHITYSAVGTTVNNTIKLNIAYSPRLTSTHSNTICQRKGYGFQCTCSLHAWPPPQIQWQMAGETLDSNSTKPTTLVTSWVRGDETISILTGNGSLGRTRHIVCIGINPLGNYTLPFQLSTGTTESPEELFTALFGSLSAASLVLLGVCLFKILLCWLVFHVTFCFLIWRKAPSKERASWPMMGMMPTESNYSSSPLESDSTQDNSVGSEIKRGGVLEHTYHR